MALQAQQIVSLACAQAKAPGFVVQAGQLLNAILRELCQTYDLDNAKLYTTITLGTLTGSGPYPLPDAYLRAAPGEVYYTIDGVKYVLV